MKKIMKKRLTFILIIAALLVAGLILSMIIYMHSGNAKIARIYQDGECIKSIDLNQVSETYTLTIENKYGDQNIIEVRPGEIGIIQASCPDKVCVHMGFIKNDMLPISCLPNKLVIRIESDSLTLDNDIDAIVR